jgi:phosphohistidine phosphatase
MKTLWLLRHAHAGEGAPDAARPLDSRGRHEAAAIGSVLAASGAAPGVALSSPARRARETLERVAAALPIRSETHFPDALYLAAPGAVLAAVGALGPGPDQVLVVGHNPGLSDLARELAVQGGGRGIPGLAGDLGTAFCAEFGFEIGAWSELDGAWGRLVAVRRPDDDVSPATHR